MSKKHSPKKNGVRGKRRVYSKTLAESLSMKIGNNEDCPCGKTKTREIFTTEGTKLVEVPIKYKKCCRGKSLFFETVEARKLAEADINKRNPKRAKDIIVEEGKKKLSEKIEESK